MRSKREYKLENREARALSESQLYQILRDCFTEKNGRGPSSAQEAGLREAAELIKLNEITWRQAERAIKDHNWDPANGARAILESM